MSTNNVHHNVALAQAEQVLPLLLVSKLDLSQAEQVLPLLLVSKLDLSEVFIHKQIVKG
jgi:hypothetical protein